MAIKVQFNHSSNLKQELDESISPPIRFMMDLSLVEPQIIVVL